MATIMKFCIFCKTHKMSHGHDGTANIYLYCVVLEKQPRAQIVETSLLLSSFKQNLHFYCLSHLCVWWGMDKCDLLHIVLNYSSFLSPLISFSSGPPFRLELHNYCKLVAVSECCLWNWGGCGYIHVYKPKPTDFNYMIV